jgi:lysophospholipase L1-like esterase
MKAVLELMQRKAPGATVILMGITPRTDSAGGASVMPTIDAINERYARFADGSGIRYININAQLARADGAPREGMTVDGLHLSLAGYQVWADALKPIFTELLGPPATIDHAPPPTGDPSASAAPPNGAPGAASTSSPTR